MITISLDEQGVFEHSSEQNNGIIMIAGIVYDDHGNSDDTEREKTRVREYFTRVCRTFRATYPEALHYQNGSDNRHLASVKNEYGRTLGEFLKKGTYKGKDVPSKDKKSRNGEYYVYALVKSPNGKPELSSDEISNLINEDYASNLYMHMVEDVISRLLFYNDKFLDEESVSLDLATRVFHGKTGEDISEHTALGYDERHVRDGEIVFLTNSDVFRTALAREMLYETENDIKIQSLEARSIDYKDAEKGHEFLYLADAICTRLGFENEYTTEYSYIEKTWERMADLVGDNRLLFLYDTVDTGFTKAWKYTDSGNVYKALSVFYDCISKSNREARFYKAVWKDILVDHIGKKIDTSSFSMAVRQFAQSTKNNNLNQDKLVFIYEALVSLANKIAFSNPQDNAVLYELFDAGATTYNHVGDSDKAKECIALCRDYIKYAGIERELRNRNKLAVSLCDSFEFDKAIKEATATHEYYKSIYDIQTRIYGDNYANTHDLGIIKSQLGQCYAFTNNSEAEKYLLEALALYDKGTPDYYQTESYLLHYYVQSGDKEKYDKYSKAYFGGRKKPLEQLEYIVHENLKKSDPLISFKYALFIYVKGIYRFYLDELSAEGTEKIINLPHTTQAIDKRIKSMMNGYPWLLIYKYLALICIAKNSDKSKIYIKKLKDINDSETILELIRQCAFYNIYKASNDVAQLEKCRQSVIDAYTALVQGTDIKPKNDAETINRLVTFTYS